MGRSGLCNFTKPLMVGAVGFKLMYFHLSFEFISFGLLLSVFLTCFWNFFVGLVLEVRELFLSVKIMTVYLHMCN